MFEKLRDALNSFARNKKIDKKEVEKFIKEIQRALILSDVNVKIVFEITQTIKKKIFEEEKHEGLSLREHTIKVVYETLSEILGKEKGELKIEPQKILLVGLYGTGKTTTAAKLAYFFKKKGLKPCLITTDTYRPAAYEQLKNLAEKIGVEFYGNKNENNAIKILQEGMKECHTSDVIIIDTAGRDAFNEELLNEINSLYKVLKPDETLLVLSADIGQAAKSLVESLKEKIKITGIILTKMDSSAKGGGALTAAYLANVKVKFLGIGEKIEDLEYYDPVRFVSRLLGMGDLETLLEKAREIIDKEKIEKLMEAKDYDMYMFYEQLKATQKMGSLNKILEMIPGMSRMSFKKEEIEEQEIKIKKWGYIFDSMTVEERKNPKIIDSSRIQRIAKGSGTTEEDVREMLKAYRMSEKLYKKFKSGKFLKDPKLRKLMMNINPKNTNLQEMM